jgi:hypothetical protein
MGWIGVDLDGTLAEYHGWDGGRIGAPVPKMQARVKQWLSEGLDVRIVTARANNGPEAVAAVRFWCEEHLGQALFVTDRKDFTMVELWDDRAVQVIPNTGERADGRP